MLPAGHASRQRGTTEATYANLVSLRDQELRFQVHDCPDYYQLKVSVFNDDKKTDLIGETWVDLRDIVVSGGGQSDQWHTLNCKGKYAGDIRVEITYYDSRPKPEKVPAPKPKQPTDNEPFVRDPLNRRPLPSNPVTGQTPSPAIPEHIQTPPRPQPAPPVQSYVPNRSPLQSVEYNRLPAPPIHRELNHQLPAPPGGGFATPSRMDQHHPPAGHQDSFPASPEDSSFSSPDFGHSAYERHDAGSGYDDGPPPFNLPEIDGRERQMPLDDDRPPPPPAHRSRHNSATPQEPQFRNGFSTSPQKDTAPMRHDVLRSEAHRHSAQASYPGRPTYKPFDSSPASIPAASQSTPEHHQPSPPRHHSYDSAYDAHGRPRQPSFTDSPESPDQMMPRGLRTHGSRMNLYDNGGADYGQAPSPAPLNLAGRGAAPLQSFNQSPASPLHRQLDSSEYGSSPPPAPPSRGVRSTSPGPTWSQYSGSNVDDSHAVVPVSAYATLPPVPSSLVPGVDPGLALELSSRIREDRKQHERHHERRHTAQPVMTPSRGRKMIEGPSSYGQSSSPPNYGGTPQHSYDRSPVSYSGGAPLMTSHARAVSPAPFSSSPNQHHTIKRKSISPAPPADGRRLSGIPFGPDSFDILNPSLVSTSSKDSRADSYADTGGKIITHDGKEIDPSDHLPMDTWAPEPEPKKPSPGGVPNNGRRALRVAGLPASSSMVNLGQSYVSPDTDSSPAPLSTGRNRLQKKANRASAQDAGALMPLSLPHQSDNFVQPARMQRASTWDLRDENLGSYSARGAPPIPAKIPIGGQGQQHRERGGSMGTMMSGALPAPGQERGGGGYSHGGGSWGSRSGPGTGGYSGHHAHGGGGGTGGMALTLEEEMSLIDIGSGRARRHQVRY
jgi:hypothetical protein